MREKHLMVQAGAAGDRGSSACVLIADRGCAMIRVHRCPTTALPSLGPHLLGCSAVVDFHLLNLAGGLQESTSSTGWQGLG